jgi:Flp pilus assembly protein TadD
VQLGLLAELQGDNPGAVSRFSQAIDREDGNWELYLLRARAERKTGQLGAARSDVAQARRLNPLGTTGPLSMFNRSPRGEQGG